jgi:hypothetical protein
MPDKSYLQGPATNLTGLIATSVGDGSGRFKWSPAGGNRPQWTPHNFVVMGTLAVPSGATNYFAPMTVDAPANLQTVQLIRAKGCIRTPSGATVTIKVQRSTGGGAPADVSGLTGISLSSGPTLTVQTLSTPVTLVDGDTLYAVITAVTGTPDSLTFGLTLAYTTLP